ncbi:MAG: hypothetical protein JWP97_3511 [Labilithrix sp.]|nr:hypothetical protein [Labilithrix sp.]
MKGLLVPAALLLVALAGSAVRTPPSWSPSRIGERYVLEGDVHVHSSFEGALSTPLDLPVLARERQLDFIAVTEHNAWFGGAMARTFARTLAPDLVVLPSEEVTNRDYHLLAIGLEARVDPQLPLSAIAREVHRQGGIVVAAHPTRDTWPLLLGLADQHALDGSEIFHPTMRGRPDVAAEHAAFADEAARRSGRALLRLGSSDYHGGRGLGVLRTIVLADAPTAAGVMDALRAGRAAAASDDGRLAGDEATVAALQGARYVPRSTTTPLPGPRGALQHALAWLGFVVMVVGVSRGRLPRRR